MKLCQILNAKIIKDLGCVEYDVGYILYVLLLIVVVVCKHTFADF